MAKSASELYEEAMAEGEELADDMRFRGVQTDAKRLDKLLDKFEKAWKKITAKS